MLKNKQFYEVSYLLKTAGQGHGEYHDEKEVKICTCLSESNDLNEIFTDLFDKHRMEGLIGIEILSVQATRQTVELKEVLL
ncbi:MAG TPA: hypothetical protein VIK89_15725 [Cytophagaceae bacterium]